MLRRTLNARGFVAEGWRQGINTGADPAKLGQLENRIRHLHAKHDAKVLLIGWSLGGLYARVLGHRIPQHLDLVMTVASPFSGDRRANRAWKVYEKLNDHSVDDPPFEDDIAAKPPVPTIAVWSGADGIVAPECCRGKQDESDYQVRIDAPHFTIGTSRACIEKLIAAIAEVDAEREKSS
ncbi:alpha/beta fold hydrolase [Aurantiacibacter spongiae]|uniref:Alpha/beta hydrolase n=1 Tax=Aurantiacibacter spongiae TaxID=2488860 RepID=A0A3N5CUU4_9SPHN|nr:alpha/beta hydrolase [Aurantiacibacter spongiae]RPF70389.1 alpha/beta hydrolase [Aurantiacibacter spongiae]